MNAGGTLIDSIGYGVALNGFTEGISVLAAALVSGSLACPTRDTNNNIADFAIDGTPTPRAANQ